MQECYRDILAGPKPAGSLPTGTDVAADSPEGRKALVRVVLC